MTSPSGLFSNFNTMDPVQKAVIKHTFGATVVPKKKQIVSCHVCELRFNSDSQAEAHYRGSRHAKRLKAQECKARLSVTGKTNGSSSSPPGPAPPVSANSNGPTSSSRDAALPPGPTSSSTTPRECEKSEEEKAKKLLYCHLCKVVVNSVSQLEAHNAGSKHKTMQGAGSSAGPIKAFPRQVAKLKNGGGGSRSVVEGSGLNNKTFHCQICNVNVNSEVQLKQHISSRRHKDKVAGKPPKPKFSPYSKRTKEKSPPPFLPSDFGLSSFMSSPLSSFPFAPPPLHPRPPSPSSFRTPSSSFRTPSSSSLYSSSFRTPSSSSSSSSLSSSSFRTPSSYSSSFRTPSYSSSYSSSFRTPSSSSYSSSFRTPSSSFRTPSSSSSSFYPSSFPRQAPGPIRSGHSSFFFPPY